MDKHKAVSGTASESHLPDAPGVAIGQSEFVTRRPVRRRVPICATVHPDTIAALDVLSAKFGSHRGQLIDRMVWILKHSYESGKVLCVHGSSCVAGRTDLPDIF
jgi:hypothetical protein